jgi:hypothetical protein
MSPPLSTFFYGVDSDNVRLNLTPCATVDPDMCIARAQWMGGGDMVFYRSSGSTVLPHLGFCFGGTDGDDGRLKLAPVRPLKGRQRTMAALI